MTSPCSQGPSRPVGDEASSVQALGSGTATRQETRCRRCLEWNLGDPWFCPRCTMETTLTPHDSGTLGDHAVWTRHAPCAACRAPMQDSDECHASGLCLRCLLGPPPPPPGDFECCASGRCEVCCG